MDPKDVALRLRAVMAHLEIETVDDLAELLGAGRSRVSNWLQGYNLPPVEMATQICELCTGINLDWLYRGVADAVPMKLAIKLTALAEGMAVPLSRREPDSAARPGGAAEKRTNGPKKRRRS